MPVIDGIYYLQSGKENDRFPSVLLIHGAGGSSLSWPAAIRRLSGYHILALDLPGHGRSEGTALQTIEAYMLSVASFLENLKISKAILVGHSMGGAIALMMAVRRSRMVAGLGLISSGAYLGGESEILEQLSTPFGFRRALQIFQEKAFSAEASPAVVKSVMQAFSKTRHSVLLSDWRASAGFDLRSEADSIAVPAWVAVGAEDQIAPLAFSHYLVNQLSNASLQIVGGAGHMILHEAPDELALGMRAFLERIDFHDRLSDLKDSYSSNESKKGTNLFSLL